MDPLTRKPHAVVGDFNFKAVSLNVRGLHKENKRRSLFNRLKCENVHICFLQETFSTSKVENRWRNEWGGKMFSVHGTNHGRGVMILLKPGLNVQVIDFHHDDIGRVLLVEAKINDTVFKLLNIYSPNCESSQVQFYKFLHKFMKKHLKSDDNIMMGGDFNVILNSQLDRKGGNHRDTVQYKQIISTLHLILSEFQLEDTWRNKNPHTKRFTWRRKRPQPCSSRLDYWFISLHLSDHIGKIDILPSYYSDHSPVCVQLQSSISDKPGKGYWRMNNSHLNDDSYINGIKEGLSTWGSEGEILDKRSR